MTDQPHDNDECWKKTIDLAHRMTLAVLGSGGRDEQDRIAFNTVFEEFTTWRDAELAANGQSDLLCRLVRTLAASAAGSILDVEHGDMDRAKKYLLQQIDESRI
jgi:hypothetical protein